MDGDGEDNTMDGLWCRISASVCGLELLSEAGGLRLRSSMVVLP